MTPISFDSFDDFTAEWRFFSVLFPTKWSGFYIYKSKLALREGEIVWAPARGKLQLGVVVGRAEERSDAAEIESTTGQILAEQPTKAINKAETIQATQVTEALPCDVERPIVGENPNGEHISWLLRVAEANLCEPGELLKLCFKKSYKKQARVFWHKSDGHIVAAQKYKGEDAEFAYSIVMEEQTEVVSNSNSKKRGSKATSAEGYASAEKAGNEMGGVEAKSDFGVAEERWGAVGIASREGEGSSAEKVGGEGKTGEDGSEVGSGSKEKANVDVLKAENEDEERIGVDAFEFKAKSRGKEKAGAGESDFEVESVGEEKANSIKSKPKSGGEQKVSIDGSEAGNAGEEKARINAFEAGSWSKEKAGVDGLEIENQWKKRFGGDGSEFKAGSAGEKKDDINASESGSEREKKTVIDVLEAGSIGEKKTGADASAGNAGEEKASIRNAVSKKQARPPMTEAQEQAFREIMASIYKKPVLLKGPTGSGKSLVYFAAIERFLAQGKQVLLLMPEISLTQSFAAMIFDSFGFMPHLWNHKSTDVAKNIMWDWAESGKPGLLVGSRSAIWLPFKNLSCIVLDEEHDQSYKQENAPRYHAREVVLLKKVPTILVSATPSLETWLRVIQQPPEIQLVKLHGEQPIKGRIVKRKGWLSEELKYAVYQTLEQGQQALLFFNRRGFASSIMCKACKELLQCDYCSVKVIYHRNNYTHCSYCGNQKPLQNCRCGKREWDFYGIGIERIEQEAKQVFPKARILMLSSETQELAEKLAMIRENKIDLIIATQILAKGHNFPNLTLVGVIQADQGANAGDPRCSERIYQLLSQVRGRCGRAGLPSQVILQVSELPKLLPKQAVEATKHASNQGILAQNSNRTLSDGANEKKELLTYQLLKAVIRNDFDTWSEKELMLRKEQKLPPYYRLIRIIVMSKDPNKSKSDAAELYSRIRNGLGELHATHIYDAMHKSEDLDTDVVKNLPIRQQVDYKIQQIDHRIHDMEKQNHPQRADQQKTKNLPYTIFPPVQTPVYKYKSDYRYSMLIRLDDGSEIPHQLNKLLKQKLPCGSSIMADVDPHSFF